MTKDRIDQFELAWIEVYPDLDPWPLRIFGRVSRLAGIIERQGKGLRADLGIQLGEIQVLAALRRAHPDFTASPKKLAQLTLVTSAAVTGRLNSLESKGLVSRHIDESNRRNILVTLTPEGLKFIESYINTVVSRQSSITSQLSDQERDECVEALRRLFILMGDTPEVGSSATDVPESGPL